jgi:hypothetical protein
MSDDTTMEIPWGIPVSETAEFKRAQEKLLAARKVADIAPAEITNQGQAGEVADALKELRFAREDTLAASKAVKAPYDAHGKKVLAAFRELGSSNAAAEEALEERVLDYQARERKREADERKKAERSERERQERENARAEKERRQSKQVQPSARPAPAPRSAKGGFAQAVTRDVTKYEVVDEGAMPDEYFDRVLNKSKVNAAIKAGLVVPGVRVWKEAQVVAR